MAYVNERRELKDYTRSIKIQQVIRFVICIIITIIALLPIYFIVVNATRAHSDIIKNPATLIPGGNIIKNFQKLNDPNAAAGMYQLNFNLFYGYRNSLFVSGSATILSVLFSGATAYGLSVYDFKFKKAARTIILAVMMIPTQVVSVGLLRFMMSIGLTNSYIPLIVPAIAAPATVFFMLQYMQSSFPLEIVEAARIDGSGEFRTFFQIALPMLKPAFAVQAIFAFVTNWNNFYMPSILLTNNDIKMKTMPMMVQAVLAMQKSVDNGVNYLVVMMSILPVVIVYLCLSKFIVRGVALGAVKG
ncbi:MAG: carbohydrate ABC transporter permease [Oscillospiraceae bacterium]|nr:carbohydrate ABC transporter permease [Oscillospiraceae bacterium]